MGDARTYNYTCTVEKCVSSMHSFRMAVAALLYLRDEGLIPLKGLGLSLATYRAISYSLSNSWTSLVYSLLLFVTLCLKLQLDLVLVCKTLLLYFIIGKSTE